MHHDDLERVAAVVGCVRAHKDPVRPVEWRSCLRALHLIALLRRYLQHLLHRQLSWCGLLIVSTLSRSVVVMGVGVGVVLVGLRLGLLVLRMLSAVGIANIGVLGIVFRRRHPNLHALRRHYQQVYRVRWRGACSRDLNGDLHLLHNLLHMLPVVWRGRTHCQGSWDRDCKCCVSLECRWCRSVHRPPRAFGFIVGSCLGNSWRER